MKVTEITNTLLQHVNDIVLYTDVDGHIEYVNPEFEKTTLFKKKWSCGQYASYIKIR